MSLCPTPAVQGLHVHCGPRARDRQRPEVEVDAPCAAQPARHVSKQGAMARRLGKRAATAISRHSLTHTFDRRALCVFVSLSACTYLRACSCEPHKNRSPLRLFPSSRTLRGSGLASSTRREDYPRKFPEFYAEWTREKFLTRFPGGESFYDLMTRLEPCVVRSPARATGPRLSLSAAAAAAAGLNPSESTLPRLHHLSSRLVCQTAVAKLGSLCRCILGLPLALCLLLSCHVRLVHRRRLRSNRR